MTMSEIPDRQKKLLLALHHSGGWGRYILSAKIVIRDKRLIGYTLNTLAEKGYVRKLVSEGLVYWQLTPLGEEIVQRLVDGEA